MMMIEKTKNKVEKKKQDGTWLKEPVTLNNLKNSYCIKI
jgi:hypothetical protein